LEKNLLLKVSTKNKKKSRKKNKIIDKINHKVGMFLQDDDD
jgi:hypothetical protein